MFGASAGTRDGAAAGAAAAFRALCERADVELVTPAKIDGLCCGTPWKSKGYADGYATAIDRTVNALLEASDHGRLPIVCDNSSCTEGLMLAVAHRAGELGVDALRIVDAVDFAAEHLLPKLRVAEQLDSLALHPTCSSTRMGSNGSFLTLAAAVAADPVVPDAWGCCGFAGDRGMLHPELTASATEAEAAEVGGRDFDAYASCNRTCEIGMTRATGNEYVHILELLERATR
jgi:D-lactate dehydrogenase